MSPISGISGSSMPLVSGGGNQGGSRAQQSFPQIAGNGKGGDVVQLSSAAMKGDGDADASVMKAAQEMQDSTIDTAVKAYVQKHSVK